MANLTRSFRHADGIGRVAYTPDGAFLYSGGSDGLVRVFSARPDDEGKDQLQLLDYHDDTAVYSMDASMESLVTGAENGRAALFDHTSREFTGLVTESPLGLAVRCVKFSPNGHRVAVASDELQVKVVDVRDISKLQTLEGHTKGVRAVTWSPDGQLITTSGCDGDIRVWDVSNTNEQEPTCIKVISELLGEEEPNAETQCQAIWHPSGRYFVVGTKSHEIAVVSRETWEREGEFAKDGHNGAITTLAFSPNGRYLCSTATDKVACIWDAVSRKVIERIEDTEGQILDLAWRPGAGSNSITFIDNQGHVSRWHDVIPAEYAHPNDAPPAGSKAAAAAAISETEQKKKRRDQELDAEDLDLGFDDELTPPPPGRQDDLMEEDDFIEDDEDDGVYQSRYAREDRDGSLPPPLAGKNKGSVLVATSNSRSSSLVKGQDAFQPGATPTKEKRRYLAFNSLGVIHVVERESHNIVSVEFHDQSAHTSEHFDDFTKFNLGCLGHNGVVYALGKRSTGGLLEYKPFSTWGSSNGGWSFSLPEGEEIRAIALGGAQASLDEEGAETLDDMAGSGKVVAATSKNFLRFFSGAGSQTYLMNLGEQIVTMAAGSEWVIVVHRKNELIAPGFQDLHYTIFDLDTYEVVQRGAVPLTKGATLSWIGFSEEQVPYMYDSTGYLSALDRARRPMQGRWVPMLDTNTLARREGKQESYWPVGVHDVSLMCVILKGGEKHPFFPTPITVDLDIQMPLLNTAETVGQLEAQLLQSSLLALHARDSLPSSTSLYSDATYQVKAKMSAYEVEMDKSVLKLIQLACKNEKHQQAVDLAKMLHTSAGLSGAIKIANLYAISALVERFETLKDVKDGIYGSSKRDRLEQQKREGKYAHLVDNRVIPDSALQMGNGSTSAGQGPNPLSVPFEAASRPKKTAKNVFSDAKAAHKPRAAPIQRQSTVIAGNGADSDEEPMHFDDEDDEDQVNSRQESVMPQDSMPPSSMPVRAPFNPFAKSVPIPASSAVTVSSQAGPSNPFSKRANGTQGNNSLKKTGSFFDRVDASNGLSPAGSKLQKTNSAGGVKQSTLFGLPPPSVKEVPEKKSNRGRKRKSDIGVGVDGEEEDCVEVTSVRKQPKKLESFFGDKSGTTKAAGKTGSSSKKARSTSATSDREDSVVVTEAPSASQEGDAPDDDAADDDDVATQEQDQDQGENAPSPMEDNTSSESINGGGPVTPADEEMTKSPVKGGSSLSKLAAFKFKAPPAVTTAPAAAVVDEEAEEES